MRKSFGHKAKNFKEEFKGFHGMNTSLIDESTHKVVDINIFVKLDKNGSICDCTRVGRSFDRIKGRPFYKKYDYSSGIFGYILEEIEKLHKSEYAITVDRGLVTEIQ